MWKCKAVSILGIFFLNVNKNLEFKTGEQSVAGEPPFLHLLMNKVLLVPGYPDYLLTIDNSGLNKRAKQF